MLTRLRCLRLQPLVGVALSAAAAFILSWALRGSELRVVLPLGFIGVVLLLALRFGMAAGIASSLLSAGIFAYMIYAPLGNWQVTNDAARRNLAWMVLGGVVLSVLFARPSSGSRNSSQR